MIQSSPSFATSLWKNRWVQSLGLLVILVLILLEPRIEAWLAGQNQSLNQSSDAVTGAQSADDDTASEESQSSASANPASEGSSFESRDRTSAPGRLKEIRSNVFQSSAGLIYRAGSEDGHRLQHVMQHAKDNPRKKIHGVFDGDGDRNIILAVIDEAWRKARQGGSEVRSQRQNDRQVYTINLRRRIGKMGGEAGKRQGYPECRYLRIVLENGNEVISAYPTRSF